MAACSTWRAGGAARWADSRLDRKSTRLNSSHGYISYAVFCLKKKKHRIADLIGHTPLLHLERLAEPVAPTVRLFAKAEWPNPGGSVNDRADLCRVRAGELAGL